jgi:hypothetical protein
MLPTTTTALVSFPENVLEPMIFGPIQDDLGVGPSVRLSKPHRRNLVKRFNVEGRRRRRMFRQESMREWEAQVEELVRDL